MNPRVKCAGIGCDNKREKNSPSNDYCIDCYERMKHRLETWREGLSGLRLLTNDRETQMRGFFAYCMPHITDDRAARMARDICRDEGRQ